LTVHGQFLPREVTVAEKGKGEQQMTNKHSTITIKDQTTSIIEDTYLLAALLTFDPSIRYSPRRDSTGNVSFEVSGRIADKMGRYYAGETASLKTYISNLKALRTAIFSMKNGRGRNLPTDRGESRSNAVSIAE
jgi:hypothetical protein